MQKGKFIIPLASTCSVLALLIYTGGLPFTCSPQTSEKQLIDHLTGELLQCIPLFFHNFRHYSGTQLRKVFICQGLTILSIEKCLFAAGKNPLQTSVRYIITQYQMP